MFDFYVYTRKVKVEKTDLLVSDSVNVYPCRFRFSKDWEGLTKTVCFRAGKTNIELVLGAESQCNIPHEVLLKHKPHLYVGVYGMKGEDLILNTIWTDLGEIYEGAKNIDSHPDEPPTPDVYQQLLATMGNLEDLDTEAKDSLVSAINEVNSKIQGGIGPDGPIPAGVSSFNGRDGAVMPKAGDYTAEMVGADEAGSAESVRQELNDYKSEQIEELNEKLDKTGGTVTGPLVFTDGVSTFALSREAQSGVTISYDGITGVVGKEDDKFSVPNMGQLQSAVDSTKDEIPTKVSELENDTGFITAEDITDIPIQVDVPTKLSQLENDVGYITEADIPEIEVPTKVSELQNDAGYITADDIPEVTVPTKVSELENDSGYITESDIPEIPTKTSDLINDSNFATEQYVQDQLDSFEGGDVTRVYPVKAPLGTIVIWSGTANDIPNGWVLCDGENNTPDLRDKFVLGAGTHEIGETGGAEEVKLTVEQMPEHSHVQYTAASGTIFPMSTNSGSNYEYRYFQSTVTGNNTLVTTGEIGSSQPHPNMPPYYVLCFIMKIQKDETDNTGGGGTTDHRQLTNRNAENQHPIEAISGLSEELDKIPAPVEALTNEELEELLK